MENTNIHKTLIIVNPAAGDGKAEKRWQEFESQLKQTQIPYQAVITEYQNHATSIVADAISSGYNRIGVFSGDGTLNEVLQGLFSEGKAELNNINSSFSLPEAAVILKRNLRTSEA